MARCMFTIYLRDSGQKVPCGKCLECRKRYVSNWSFRLMQEDRDAISSAFITLTYDNDNLYLTRNGKASLDERDLQLFFKRLRKAHSTGKVSSIYKRAIYGYNYRGINIRFNTKPQPIKYYAVGEYGTKTKRPHYHIILFNADIELIESCWKHGEIHYGDVSGASVGYTLKYLCKPKKIGKDPGDDRKPEFAVMSKGIGMSYLSNQAICEWHLADIENRMYVNLQNGKKASMPRYIRERLYLESELRQVQDANVRFINERQLATMETQTMKELKVMNAFKKHSNDLLVIYASKGHNKI